VARPQIYRLALADLLHDRLVSFCQLALLVALFSPLLLLFSLKYGIVTTLLDDLAGDPATLQVKPIGAYHLGPDFFAALHARPDVRFVIPETRPIATQIYLSRAAGPGDAQPAVPPATDVQMIATGPGDPLGEGHALADAAGGISLSAAAARKLGVGPGAALLGRIERSRAGRTEVASIPLHVIAVLPERLHPLVSAFVALSLLVASERYRDGFATPLFKTGGDRPWQEMTEFASLRLYAAKLQDVAGLAAFLRGQGVEVTTAAAQIEGVLSLDRNLTILFGAVTALAGLGFVGAIAASMVSSVERKRRSMAVLSLIGLSRGAILAFPLLQAATIAILGAAVGSLLVLAGMAAINAYFLPVLHQGELAARLRPEHLAVAALAALLLTGLPAMAAAWRASRVEPSEALREI
jgi:putative ABC transport system permease protein